MSNNKNPNSLQLQLLSLQRGIPLVLGANATMAFRGATLTGPQALQMVNTLLGFFEDVETKRTALGGSIEARRTQTPTVVGFLKDFTSGATTSFGETSTQFQQLGLAPKKKPVPLTSEQKQLKKERTLATRQARGTMGKRQRQSVKGVVPPPTPPATGGTASSGNGAAPK